MAEVSFLKFKMGSFDSSVTPGMHSLLHPFGIYRQDATPHAHTLQDDFSFVGWAQALQ